VGALRDDKGAKDLVSIATASERKWQLRIIGAEKLSASDEQSLLNVGVATEYVDGDKGPSDADLVAALVDCSLMVAPYRSVTESGSVLMALTLGVPVLGYLSEGLEDTLTAASMAEGPEELGRLISEFLNESWDTTTISKADRLAKTTLAWGHALG
jgi:glycosyltransferase involved in cell wall biosynthesis